MLFLCLCIYFSFFLGMTALLFYLATPHHPSELGLKHDLRKPSLTNQSGLGASPPGSHSRRNSVVGFTCSVIIDLFVCKYQK